MEIIDMKECVIYGAGTYGEVYASYLKEMYNILGFIDDNSLLIGKTVNKFPVLGNSKYLFSKLKRDVVVFVPIGNNQLRVSLFEKLNQEGFTTPNFIHPKTLIDSSVSLGKGVYILPSTNVMPFTKIADYSMISMGVNIAHHVYIEKGCFFSQGTNIGASINIKEKAYFGIGATVMTGVTSIGENALIGAGSVVINNIPANCTAVGVPAKPL
ncbi:acetyltransferase [Marixanthomonas spongiae]|uniref:Sialic acid O-acetyltransferase n=1 Tax=Marixanthomonas spongiae TaxID=2174845 RepID=A0A2U0I3Q5_9FLAO|nr:acetyltransferase [Marixanthomonas spongiae]PVW15751.1 sialic acid O-acetyltransferase [Marixanthomonas spongiae]